MNRAELEQRLRERIIEQIRAGVDSANESFRAAGIDAAAFYPMAITIEKVKQ